MKKLWFVLASLILLACLCPAIPLTARAPNTPTTVVSDPVEPLSLDNATVLRLYPRDGALADQLHAEAPNAEALGQHMFVEFDASW